MSGAIPPLPQYAFMAWCVVKKHRDSFTFTFYPYINIFGTSYCIELMINERIIKKTVGVKEFTRFQRVIL
jgi:hypothetical protein